MCGSFLISVEDSDEVSRILRVLSQRYAKAPRDEQDTEAAARFSSLLETRAPTALFPRARIPAIWIEDGETQPTLMHWGLPGFSGGREIINARCETAAVKPLFSSDLAHRRCVIPATGFFEWSPDRQRFRFDAADRPELYLAGIYDATLPVPAAASSHARHPARCSPSTTGCRSSWTVRTSPHGSTTMRRPRASSPRWHRCSTPPSMSLSIRNARLAPHRKTDAGPMRPRPGSRACSSNLEAQTGHCDDAL